MGGIADFLDSLIGGVDRVFFCAAIGSLIWGLLLLKPWSARYNDKHLSSTVTLLYFGALGLAITQAFALIVKIWLIRVTLEQWPFPAFAETIQFKGGIVRLLVFATLAVFTRLRLSAQPTSLTNWRIATGIGLLAVVAGAWLTHGAGRFDYQAQLMTLTVIHQVSAAAWVGGIFQLLNIWFLHKKQLIEPNWWPHFLKQFSTLGLAAVVASALTGLPMTLHYIDTWNGFLGTGYGNLLMVKLLLLGLALFLAYLNNRGSREYSVHNQETALSREVPNYMQAETFILISLLFTAVSLSTQPPAIDIHETTATWQETLAGFTPRLPRLQSPTHEELMAGEAGRTAIVGQVPSPASTTWSDYNHNISGIFVTVISLMSMLSYVRKTSPGHIPLWPIGFVLLGLFLFVRSDPEAWPLGPIGFWDSTFNNGEILQHRIATLLAAVLGILEFKARHPSNTNQKLIYMFPLLAGFGGLMLLTHSHIGFQPKTAFLIQSGHTLMGVFAIILASSRWLEIQLHDERQKNLAGFISAAAMLQVGMILMFYREPLY